MADEKTPPVVVEPGTPQNPGVQVAGTVPSAPNGGGEMSHGVIDAETPGFFTTTYDRDVVKFNWASTPINMITRKIGFKKTMSLRYGYWSLAMRESTGVLTEAVTVSADDVADRNNPLLVELKVENAARFDVTDQIVFKGVDGVDDNGTIIHLLPCNARVYEINRPQKKVTVQFFNAAAGTVIPAGTTILILGHALQEGDARVTPHAASPTPTYQHMQKFMTSASVTNEYLEANKEANYGLTDLTEMNNQQFIEEIEKSYVFGIRSLTYDPQTNAPTYTCAGIIQQLLEGGAHKILIPKSKLNDDTIIDSMSEIFTGNTGSTQRYLFDGMEFYTSLLKIKDVRKQINVNEPIRRFEYDWSRIRLSNYTLLQMPYPFLDKFGYSNYGIVLDLKYVERRVFRAMTDDQLDLMAIGVKDAKEIRCCEISSILVKYPQCHALIVITDDEEGSSSAGSSKA